jgi:hypothetical protein
MSVFQRRQRSGFESNSAGAIRRMLLAVAALACCLIVVAAQAQHENPGPAPQTEPPAAEAPPPGARPGFLDTLGRWFGDSKAAIDSQFRGTQETLGTLGGRAKDAAGSVAAIPGTRIITGRQLCPLASNGAPDCQQGVEALCRTKGFQSGRSLDVTSSQRCPAKIWISGRAPQEGECRLDTYVTRAVCQ